MEGKREREGERKGGKERVGDGKKRQQ